MSGPLLFLLCFCCLAAWSPWPLPAARALPLCTDGRAPVALNMTLGFCSVYSRGSDSCCDAAADAGLRKWFEAMGVKDAACAAVVKSVLCAKCNPYSAELFNTSSRIQRVPLLCNNTSSSSSVQSKDSTQDYCKQVWGTCKNVAIVNSPFQTHMQGKCSCNSDAGCDPSKLGGTDADDNAQPCQYQVVVSEYSTKLSSSNISTVASADPSEVRRIFTMGMPFASHYGGQILFGPTDGYLYLVIGDGGRKGDPFYFSQNKKSLLGKILRLDIDSTQGQRQTINQSLWGNYSVPKDNPFVDDSDLQPEIWAMGLGNSWRCSFDSESPSYFYCGDCGQDMYEEVNLITKGGNYGWPVYEGPYVYHPQRSPGGNTLLELVNPIFPVMGYNHSAVNGNSGSASIAGAPMALNTTLRFCSSYGASSCCDVTADAALRRRFAAMDVKDAACAGVVKYLFTDLYSSSMWTGIETPEGSGNYTSSVIPMSCSKNSPIACDSTAEPSFGYIFTFGDDNSKDIYI
ncbi:hypothetical protein QOZ80_3AG0220840 [Eleusine coracana subsp. coracana]|nr:hypothetical protein QOZ80_3AG0220840 [Eleusine coracana subsp. coracana]